MKKLLLVATFLLLGVRAFAQDPTNIIGGRVANINEAPWQVSLRYQNSHNCGGSVISSTWILTAAHCVYGFPISSLSILAGATDQTTGAGGQLIPVAQVIINPDYNPQTSNNDIALIRLAQPLSFNCNIQSIQYSNSTNTPAHLIEPANPLSGAISMASLSGWGRTISSTTSPPSTLLRLVDIPIISNADASAINARVYANPNPITDNMLALFESGKGAAPGDSGGPMVIEHSGAPILVGCSSWGYYPKDQLPTIYTKVRNYAQWIQSNSGVAPLSVPLAAPVWNTPTLSVRSTGSVAASISPVPGATSYTWLMASDQPMNVNGQHQYTTTAANVTINGGGSEEGTHIISVWANAYPLCSTVHLPLGTGGQPVNAAAARITVVPGGNSSDGFASTIYPNPANEYVEVADGRLLNTKSNPSQAQLQVTTLGKNYVPMQVRVYNYQGNIVFESSNKSNLSLRLHTQDWPTGLYQVVVRRGGTVTRHQLSLQH